MKRGYELHVRPGVRPKVRYFRKQVQRVLRRRSLRTRGAMPTMWTSLSAGQLILPLCNVKLDC